jgi:DNA-binding protein HU-beta
MKGDHWRTPVNKRELVGQMAVNANLTRVQAAKALEALLAGIKGSLRRGDRVTISGFGTFDVSHRKARRLRNPRSGRAIEVRARKVPRFAPSPDLRDSVEEP